MQLDVEVSPPANDLEAKVDQMVNPTPIAVGQGRSARDKLFSIQNVGTVTDGQKVMHRSSLCR